MSRRNSSVLSQFKFQTSLKFALISASLLVILGFGYEATAGAGTHDEKCETGLTADNRTLDTCATEKFLTCQSSRCACADIRNQIWLSKRVPVGSGSSRSRRSPAKGFKAPKSKGFKAKGSVIIPVIIPVGAATPVRRRFTTQAPQRFETFSACYSRVGGTCLLEASKYSDSVISISVKGPGPEPIPTAAAQEATPITTPSVMDIAGAGTAEIEIPAQNFSGTTPAPALAPVMDVEVEKQGGSVIYSATDELQTNSSSTEWSIASSSRDNLNSTEITKQAENSNGTQTNSSSSTGNNTTFNIETSRLSIPKCVQFAVCRPRAVKIENGKVISDPDDPKDDQLGVCVCVDGFVKNEKDVCVQKVVEPEQQRPNQQSRSCAIRKSGWNLVNFVYVFVLCLSVALL